MGSNVFKKVRLQLYSNNFDLKQLYTTVKTKALDSNPIYTFILLEIICMCCYAFPNDDPCSHDFLLTSLYINSNKIIMTKFAL